MCVRGRVASVDVGKDRPLHEAAMRQPYSRCAWAHAAYIDAQPGERPQPDWLVLRRGCLPLATHRCSCKDQGWVEAASMTSGASPRGRSLRQTTPIMDVGDGTSGTPEACMRAHVCAQRVHMWAAVQYGRVGICTAGMRFAECGAQKSMAAELLMWPLSGGARDTGPIDASCTYSNRVGADVPDIGVLRCT